MERIIFIGIGGVIPIILISLLISRFAFKDLDNNKKVIYSTLVAYLIALIISGFGNANGGPFDPLFFEYLFSSILVIAIRIGFHNFRNRKKG
tara:strand:+ start:153 stop:428 length:276 start_codon:yes stop_codon:yes gene_type:complete